MASADVPWGVSVEASDGAAEGASGSVATSAVVPVDEEAVLRRSVEQEETIRDRIVSDRMVSVQAVGSALVSQRAVTEARAVLWEAMFCTLSGTFICK